MISAPRNPIGKCCGSLEGESDRVENKIVVAVKAIIVNRGRILIIKRSDRDDTGAGTWETAGGKIEFGEELESALLREVKEETGIDITVEKLLYATTFKTNPARQVVVLTYLCRTQQEDVTLSNEHSAYLWASKSQLRMHLLPDILLDFDKNNVFALGELV